MVSVKVDPEKCTGCKRCVEGCPAAVLQLADGKAGKVVVVAAQSDCSACGTCALKCPEQAITVTGYELRKVAPPPDYPPEDGRYLRGNDYSPVAVVAILDTYDFKIPPELTRLLTTAIEAGAALAGTLQTENIGIEKVVANIVANPNIRFLVLCWREANGHRPAETLRCLLENGVANDKRRTIVGATAPTPYLANISLEAIQRFRQQITLVNLIHEDDPKHGMRPEKVDAAVHACIQEAPTMFDEHVVFDPGAWPAPAICQKLSMRVTEPWRPELSTAEAQTIEQMKAAGAAVSEPPQNARVPETGRKEGLSDDLLLEFLGLKKPEPRKDEKRKEQRRP